MAILALALDADQDVFAYRNAVIRAQQAGDINGIARCEVFTIRHLPKRRKIVMKYSLLSGALLAVAVSASPMMAQTTPPPPPDSAVSIGPVDRDSFVKTALSSNDWEIQSSELAKKQASSPDIKSFASMIIDDHVTAGVKLKETLDANNESMPSAALTSKHQDMLDQLKSAQGEQFDKLYVDMQTQAHVEAIALFRGYSQSGDDKALAGFARETLPTLEAHLAHVKELGGAK